MRSPARLRERERLEKQIAALTQEGMLGSATEFHRGALDALRWVTNGGPGPLTGCFEDRPVSIQAIVRELAVAEDVIHGPQISPRRDYCQGLEHALMWAQRATAAPPTIANSCRADATIRAAGLSAEARVAPTTAGQA